MGFLATGLILGRGTRFGFLGYDELGVALVHGFGCSKGALV